ncbi:hypothetical protein ACEWPM_015885 [Roseovarius sp. S4756]|uniref:hypothetical protein n=1 Tax=Roseovarius maritimus TaxID=3342637 RepID=UPI00372C64CB
MKRFALIAALCVPVAGLATTFDGGNDTVVNTVEIRVSQSELADCQETLRELRQRPVVTDDGFKLPAFMRSDDLPRTVCVVEA